MNSIDRAIYYLNIKPRTRQQVIDYLEKKEFPSEEIEETIKELEEYHYIDDLNYCKMYFELGFEKHKGIGRIKRELAGKGVSKEVIEEAFNELEYVPDQFEMALEAGRSILSDAGIYDDDFAVEEMGYQEKQKLKAKIARRLATKGFATEIIYDVIRELVDR